MPVLPQSAPVGSALRLSQLHLSTVATAHKALMTRHTIEAHESRFSVFVFDLFVDPTVVLVIVTDRSNSRSQSASPRRYPNSRSELARILYRKTQDSNVVDRYADI